MVCFSVVSPSSFASIRQKWLPEIRRSLSKSVASGAGGSGPESIPPFILVGTQCDLRHDVKVLIELDAAGQQPISSDYARAMASKFGAMCYIEWSALTQKNLKVCVCVCTVVVSGNRFVMTHCLFTSIISPRCPLVGSL